jgi:hypothetical protein
MKKLPLFIIACLLVSVTTWAGWGKSNPRAKNIFSSVNPTVSCSADGKIIYLVYTAYDSAASTSGAIILYKSSDGGETWLEQVMAPGLNPAK